MARAKKEPLKSYNPDGNVIATSFDGGVSWSGKPTPEPEPVLRQYSRRIAALMPDHGPAPSWERRIAASFAPLADAEILTGWGPLAELLAMPDDRSLDALVITGSQALELDLVAIETKAKTLVIDLDTSDLVDRSRLSELAELIKRVDAVLLPSDLLAMSLRAYNPNVFCVPPVLTESLWTGAKREAKPGVIRLALQPTGDRHLLDAIRFVKERYGEKLEVFDDDWRARSPLDEPGFYTTIDVVAVGPVPNRVHLTNQNLLGPMAAGCLVLADLAYNRTIQHDHSGVLVATGPSPWRKALVSAIEDSRKRLKLGQGARARVRHFTGRAQLNRLALPYRTLIKI